jgi:hypothetical protein
MKLFDQQVIFAQNVGKLIDYVFKTPFTCTLGEVYRTPEQAVLDAKKGIGIKDSLHIKRLAIDLNLFKNGKYLTDSKDYATLGAYWKSLHVLNSWGGDFPKPDGNHFNMREG